MTALALHTEDNGASAKESADNTGKCLWQAGERKSVPALFFIISRGFVEMLRQKKYIKGQEQSQALIFGQLKVLFHVNTETKYPNLLAFCQPQDESFLFTVVLFPLFFLVYMTRVCVAAVM